MYICRNVNTNVSYIIVVFYLNNNNNNNSNSNNNNNNNNSNNCYNNYNNYYLRTSRVYLWVDSRRERITRTVVQAYLWPTHSTQPS